MPPASLLWMTQMVPHAWGLAGIAHCGSLSYRLAQVLPNSKASSPVSLEEVQIVLWPLGCLQCHHLPS